MKPRYLQAEQGARDRWMVSYLDVLTILLIFFVALAAKNLEPPRKPHPPPAPPASPPRAGLAELQKQLDQFQAAAKYLSPDDIRLEPRGLVISLPQSVLFRAGEDHVAPSAMPVIRQIAGILRAVPNEITLAGHADAAPVHNRRFHNNWELAAARSLRLLEVLSARYGIPESRLSIASFGSNDPRSPNDTPGGRARNRRVEIVIRDWHP